MRVGIDIDNTIICYDKAFASLAKKTGFDVPPSASKQEVKAWFHQHGLHEEFTILQGQIYGKFISMAHIFEGVPHFIADAIRQRHQLFLVSHKTKYPIKGDQVDLHEAAINFLSQQNIVCDQKPNAIPFDHVYFEQTLESKVQKIADLNLDFFIDDLLVVLTHEKFPETSRPIWFSSETACNNNPQIQRCKSWVSINDKILGAA